MGRSDNPTANSHPILSALIVCVVVIVYSYCARFINTDMTNFLVPWYNYILVHGRISALADNFSDYTPPYLYLLSIGSLADGWLPPILIIKVISVAAALFLACCAHVLLKQVLRREPARIAALLTLLLPAVVIDSVAWGQCDAIYAGLVVLGLAFALQRRDVLAAAMFGAAIAFKLQAIFVAPFGLFLLLAGIVRLRSLVVSVATWCLLMLPAWMAGRPIRQLATIYLDQADHYKRLSLNAPNIWTYVQHFKLISYDNGTILGIAVAACVTLAIAAIAHRRRMTGNFDLMLIALLSCLAVPYFLPKMHERYFFLADVLSFLLACSFRSAPTVLAAILIAIGSQLAVANFLLHFSLGAAIGGLFVSAALGLVSMMFVVRAFPHTARWLPLLRRLPSVGEPPPLAAA